MIIGVPKEIKIHEYRVGLVPSSVHVLCQSGHKVLIEHGAGIGIGYSDEEYEAAGAQIVQSAAEVFAAAELIIKVKEPQPSETPMLQREQVLFTFLHLAPDPIQTQGLVDSKCVAIAYETVTDARGTLPLLTPMSEVAGRMSVQVGTYCLQKHSGGSGILLGGIPGVESARVVVIGGGVVGTAAARMALGLGAQVTILDRSQPRLWELDSLFGPALQTVYSTPESIERYVAQADLVIGAVLLPGAAAPKLVTKAHVSKMRPGSALVDVAIDQGGCFETSRPTTHADPTYVVDGIVHYCVTNMPGGVPRTSAQALNNATLPHIMALASKGYKHALADDAHLRDGLNVYHGKVTNAPVATALDYTYKDPEHIISAF